MISISRSLIGSNTLVVHGTLGANRERKADQERLTNPKKLRSPKHDGYLVYNLKTKIAAFYDLNNRNLRTYMSISRESDQDDIVYNRNLN